MRRCPRCTAPLIAGRCTACDARRWVRLIHREVVLAVVLVAVVAVTFLITRGMAEDHKRLQQHRAAYWYATAQDELRAGQGEAALTALRRAALRDPTNPQYRLALGAALVANGRDDEARRVLLALRDAHPEDADTNLQLAHLEARAGDPGAARRYYQAAIAALWRPGQVERRRQLRLELIELLLARGDRPRALAELLVVATDLPDDAALRARVGRGFLRAGDAHRALEQLAGALLQDANNRNVLMGAAEAAFAAGDYLRARRYLDAMAPPDARTTRLREATRLIIQGDPLAPRIGLTERRTRLVNAFTRARERLRGCVATADDTHRASLETLHFSAAALAPTITRPTLPRDDMDDAQDFVYRIERTLDERCPSSSTVFDRAIILIGRRHAFDRS